LQRYWDGEAWTDHVAPHTPAAAPVAAAPQPVVVQMSSKPVHVSGLTTGQHILHGTLTFFTGGVWGIVWAWKAFMGRRRIG
jgi:hypothetical protein